MPCDRCGGERGHDGCTQCARNRLLPDGGERDESNEDALSPSDIVDDEILDRDQSSGESDKSQEAGSEQTETTDPLASDSGEVETEPDDSDSLSDADDADSDGVDETEPDNSDRVAETGGGDSTGLADTGAGSGLGETPNSQSNDRAEDSDIAGEQRERLGKTETGIVPQLKALPWRWGGVLGGLIVVVPYLLLSILVTVIHERNPAVAGSEVSALDVGAEVFLSLLAFGSPDRIRDALVGVAGIDLDAVDPADYPTVQDEVAPTLQFIQDAPAALLLGLYLLIPYLLLRAGAWLATEHAPGKRARDHLAAGLAVVVGVLPIVVLVALIFTVVDFGGKVLVGGLLVPVVFGGIGGLSAWAYDESLRMSGAFGVGAVGVGLVAAFVLVGLVAEGSITLSERLVAGLLAYLEVVQFTVGTETAARALFVVALIALLAAGVLRAWSVRDSLSGPAAGARVGASIAYGVVWTVGVLLWFVPFALILAGEVPTPLGPALVAESRALSTTLGGYRNALILAGIVVPGVVGAVGGALAVKYRDSRESA